MAAARPRSVQLLFIYLVLQAIVTAAAGLPALRVEPSYLHDLIEQENKTVQITVSMTKEQYEAANQAGDQWRISARSLHPSVADTKLTDDGGQVGDDDTEEISFTLAFNASSLWIVDEKRAEKGQREERYYSMQTALTVRGKLLGKTDVEISLIRTLDSREEDDGEEETTKKVIDVWVQRSAHSGELTSFFFFSLMFLVPTGNFLTGCELDLANVVANIKHPIAPLIGLTEQLVLAPVIAYAIAKWVFVPYQEYALALGLFVTACSPGGSASAYYVKLFDGNVNLSEMMTFLSTLASLFFMPFWFWLLGNEFLVGFSAGSEIKVPYAKICFSLFSLVVPVSVGMIFACLLPRIAAKARKMTRAFFLLAIVYVSVFGIFTHIYMLHLLSTRAVVGGLLLPLCVFVVSFIVSILSGRSPADVTAIAIETIVQQNGVSILLLQSFFPSPDSDISSLMPVIIACLTPIPPLVCAVVHKLFKCMKKRNGVSLDVERAECTDEKAVAESSAGSSTPPNPSPDSAVKERDLITFDQPQVVLSAAQQKPVQHTTEWQNRAPFFPVSFSFEVKDGDRLALLTGDQPHTGLMPDELQQSQQQQSWCIPAPSSTDCLISRN